jgi:GNAT superfamily N-acetyltransferase
MKSGKIVFRHAKKEDEEVVSQMMRSLYEYLGAPEDYVTKNKIDATFRYLFSPQNHLWIEVFETDDTIIGYALLFDFWYNEYGGKVLQLDELFVAADFRGKGLASSYIKKLSENNDYVAVALEVLPENKKAYGLYQHLGFEEKETRMMFKTR